MSRARSKCERAAERKTARAACVVCARAAISAVRPYRYHNSSCCGASCTALSRSVSASAEFAACTRLRWASACEAFTLRYVAPMPIMRNAASGANMNLFETGCCGADSRCARAQPRPRVRSTIQIANAVTDALRAAAVCRILLALLPASARPSN